MGWASMPAGSAAAGSAAARPAPAGSEAVHLGHHVGLGQALLRGTLVDVDKEVVHAPAAVRWVADDLAAHAARRAEAGVPYAHCGAGQAAGQACLEEAGPRCAGC